MSSSDDHRKKNILLAKNLNDVKVDLRNKKKDLAFLKSQLRLEKKRNSNLQTVQMSILNRIDSLRKELDDTFVKNTFGYIHLSKQLDQMHQNSVRRVSENGLSAEMIAANSTYASSHSSFLSKIKVMSESFIADESVGEQQSNDSTLNRSTSTNDRDSLSFNTFRLGLNSTFVMEDSAGSVLDSSFLAEQDENESVEETTPSENNQNHLNVTIRKGNKIKTGLSKAKARLTSTLREMHSMATGSRDTPAPKTYALRRAGRLVNKIDYNETSFRRKHVSLN